MQDCTDYSSEKGTIRCKGDGKLRIVRILNSHGDTQSYTIRCPICAPAIMGTDKKALIVTLLESGIAVEN